jgi:lipoprotein-anchoring transpeptidase ErfK/SrfK
MSKNKKRKIRIFHPRKLWFGLAIMALTMGIGLGEANLQTSLPDVMIGKKLTRTPQTFSWKGIFGGKLGHQLQSHKVSNLDPEAANPLDLRDAPLKSGVKAVCLIGEDADLERTYSAEVVEVKINNSIEPGSEFRAEVYIKNTGNVNWYGLDANCQDKAAVNMGTNKKQDRASRFFEDGEATGWVGTNRVKMVQDLIKPDEVATFAFTAMAPNVNTIHREHFNLVAEGVSWFDDFNVPVDIRIGVTNETDEYELQFLKDVSTDTRSLEGEHKLKIDLSDQSMILKIGEKEVYHMTVSTGAYDTPTPTGIFHTMNKQELRVGGASPHYRMPYWQGFTRWGHGLHALPYLGDPGGWFWEEALDHIGIPVSHGCIRMLPTDAVLVFEFGDVGMEIEIVR